MKVNHYDKIEEKPVEMPGASGCRVRWLVGEEDGAPNFAMRQFTVEAGGYTPRHHHPYEHEVYVLEGSGLVFEGDTQHAIAAGDVIFVKPGEVHQFRNTGTAAMKFLCMVPNSAAGGQVTVVPECGVPTSQDSPGGV